LGPVPPRGRLSDSRVLGSLSLFFGFVVEAADADVAVR
jgi:hypothetical protein